MLRFLLPKHIGSGSKGQNIIQELKKHNFLLLKPKSELLKKKLIKIL